MNLRLKVILDDLDLYFEVNRIALSTRANVAHEKESAQWFDSI